LNDVLSHVGTRFVQFQDAESLYITLNEIKPEWIFHLACNGAYPWQNDWREMIETNILGSINLLECASKLDIGAFVNSGCSSEYGTTSGHTPESQNADPKNYYALTKSAQTMTARMSSKIYVPTLRLYSVYGPWQSPRDLIPNLILYGLKGALPPNVEAPLQDYVYIDDVIDAYLSAAQKLPYRDSSPIYNVGSGTLTGVEDLVDISIKEFGLKAKNKISSNQNGTGAADITKIRKSLEWYPSIEMEIGFKKFATWFRENPDFVEMYKIKLTEACL